MSYSLSNVSFEVIGESIRITATTRGPEGSSVSVRAWLSNERGTVSETALEPVDAGSGVMVDVPIPPGLDPSDTYTAYIRIESALLETRQVVAIPLTVGDLL